MRIKYLAAVMSTFISLQCFSAEQKQPNILLIVADDMGFSDISPFGGEIPTPNIQQLADNGVKMSQYYTSPMSAPSRAMLMTGNSNQQAGVGAMYWYQNTAGKTGYEMRLTNRVTTVAERFKDAGYETLMAGKWHLGDVPSAYPTARGFEHAFALTSGGASHFNDVKPLGTSAAFETYYTLDGKRTLPPEGFYSTNGYANHIIEWLNKTPSKKPVFAYLAFTAPHDPLQAPEEWIKKFKGKYDRGYESVYRNRIKNLQKLGIINKNTPLPELNLQKDWDNLTPEGQKIEARTMEVYAAMISYMDNQIGRVVKALKKTGRYNNTIIIFLTDNGANASVGMNHYRSDPSYWKQFNNKLENIGKKNSFVSLGPQWANVADAPYANFHKTTSAQGGINTDFIISYPPLNNHDRLIRTPVSVWDVAPTLYDMSGIDEKK